MLSRCWSHSIWIICLKRSSCKHYGQAILATWRDMRGRSINLRWRTIRDRGTHTQTSSKKIQVRNNKYYLSSLFLYLGLELSTLYSFSIGVFTLLIFSRQIDKVILFHRGYQYMPTAWNLLTRIKHLYQLSLAHTAYHCYAASLCDLWSVQQTAVQSDMFCQIQQWERAFKNSPCICQTTTTDDTVIQKLRMWLNFWMTYHSRSAQRSPCWYRNSY